MKDATPQGSLGITRDLGVLSAAGQTRAIDLQSYPSSSLQVVADGGGVSALSLDWEISNVDIEAAYVKFVTGVTQADLTTKDKGLVIIPTGVRFARANVISITGKVRVFGFAQAQS